MLVHARCSKGQHRAQSWFANDPVVVRSLPIQSSLRIHSQYTACLPQISRDLIKFFGLVQTSGYGLARSKPEQQAEQHSNNINPQCSAGFSQCPEIPGRPRNVLELNMSWNVLKMSWNLKMFWKISKNVLNA